MPIHLWIRYWDWAEERVQHEGLPSVFYSKTVEITLPEGKKAQIENPLSYFPIEQVPPDFTDETDEDVSLFITCNDGIAKDTFKTD